ncbi:hypothetical protein KIN20_009626, partial [Parelaphostrongylus tenuis]
MDTKATKFPPTVAVAEKKFDPSGPDASILIALFRTLYHIIFVQFAMTMFVVCIEFFHETKLYKSKNAIRTERDPEDVKGAPESAHGFGLAFVYMQIPFTVLSTMMQHVSIM